MAQLVIKHWMPLPLPVGELRDVVGDAAHHLRRRTHRLVATALAVAEHVHGRRRIEPVGRHLRRESPYLETARMAREMFRL